MDPWSAARAILHSVERALHFFLSMIVECRASTMLTSGWVVFFHADPSFQRRNESVWPVRVHFPVDVSHNLNQSSRMAGHVSTSRRSSSMDQLGCDEPASVSRKPTANIREQQHLQPRSSGRPRLLVEEVFAGRLDSVCFERSGIVRAQFCGFFGQIRSRACGYLLAI